MGGRDNEIYQYASTVGLTKNQQIGRMLNMEHKSINNTPEHSGFESTISTKIYPKGTEIVHLPDGSIDVIVPEGEEVKYGFDNIEEDNA